MLNNYIKSFVCFSVISLLSACSLIEKVKLTNNENVQTGRQQLRGIIKINLETQQDSLILCDMSKEYQIYLSDDVYEEIKTMSQFGQTVYAEFFGQFTGASNATVFNVTQLNLMSTEINLCQYPTVRSRAFGNEPFWNVEIDKDQLSYSLLGESKLYAKTLSKEITPNRLTYQTNAFQLTLEQELCQDGMSDSIFGWSATLIKDKAKKQGCAKISAQDFDVKEK